MATSTTGAVAWMAIAACLAACGSKQAASPSVAPPTTASAAAAGAAPVAPAANHADAPDIAWFDGDVDAAFAAARAQHKPVFLYWGASWCPPCHQLKSTVFSRPDFIAKTRLFIPVYLDGDDAGAQKWGDRFRVTGYPTLVVLNEKREEVLRIAGGMDLTQYANVLDLALGDLQPIANILASAAQGHALAADQCRRLAVTGWGLEELADNEIAPLARNLSAAAMHCPATSTADRARLQIFAASYAADAEKVPLKAGKPPSAALRQHVKQVYEQLADPAAATANADALGYLGESFWRAAKASGLPAADFYSRFAAVMDRAAVDSSFAEADQLAAIASKLEAAKVLTGAIEPALAKQARARVDTALAGKQIQYVRTGLINASLGIFELLGQNEDAYRIVQAELPTAQFPYYFKADLAELAESLGRKDEAVSWAQQAYEESKGAATRFQWGRLYLTALLRLQPDDTARIQQVGEQVLGELDGTDRIYRRARLRLVSLDGELRTWQKQGAAQRAPVLHALRQRLQKTCGGIPATEPARTSCDAFLAGIT
jgi:thiol-disulfide isomerase/thioredoxin